MLGKQDRLQCEVSLNPQVTLLEYCRPFKGASFQWPDLPLPVKPSLIWWQQWLDETPKDLQFQSLLTVLPQLLIKPHNGASHSEIYKNLVLLGKEDIQVDQDKQLRLKDPQGFSVRLANHPCGSMPVIEITEKEDFLNVVRCLVYRCELTQIQPSVHAQAVAGLIHWGLIRKLNFQERAQLIILHRSPYSSLPASIIPGEPTTEQWLNISQVWRLEHELTHIATKCLVGEMRLNLFDELVADALGMLNSLGLFSAEIFRLGLGLNVDATSNQNSRVHTYIKGLNKKESTDACEFVLQRAQELEKLLEANLIPHERIALLRYLTKQQLNQSFLTAY